MRWRFISTFPLSAYSLTKNKKIGTAFEPKEFIGQDDTIVVSGHHAGIVKSTGKTFDHDWAMSFKMNNRKVQHCFAYVDVHNQTRSFK